MGKEGSLNMGQAVFEKTINNLPVIAEKEKWVPSYDKDLDFLYWTKYPLSNNCKLVKVSHETSLYINAKKEVEGVLVEYLVGNFISHNPSLKGITKQFNKELGNGMYTVVSNKDTKKLFSKLGEGLRADIYQDATKVKGGVNYDVLVNLAVNKSL